MRHFLINLFIICLLNINIYAQTSGPKQGTPADTILTNEIIWYGDNIDNGTNTSLIAVDTNAGGEFISSVDDNSNGYPFTSVYFTNAIRNWGNTSDTFILSIAATNTNGGCYSPWEAWFEDLSHNKITNLAIAKGETNQFLFVIQPGISAKTNSWIEYKIVAKSSNSTFVSNINTTIYTGDNNYIYGGPTNSGLGTGSMGSNYITINSQATLQDNEFIRLIMAESFYYYVNDPYTASDRYCTVDGDDANNGTSPSTPKRTITNLLSTYNLTPGAVVFIDNGTYIFS